MNIKSTVARRLSSHTKSRLRARLAQFGVIQPRKMESVILQSVRLDGARTFLQIGANDGQYADPLNLAVHQKLLTGCLVEPQPDFFRALQETYRGIEGLEFQNVGIADEKGVLTLYTFDKNDYSIPAWLLGSSSFDREKVTNSASRVPGAVERIVELPIELITIAELLQRTRFKQPDIVVVDAEGFDARILRQFDLSTVRPKLFLFESDAFRPGEADAVNEKFEAAGYVLKAFGQDSCAMRSDTKLAKA